jgi:uncharacterized protein (TIGR02246 family)
MNHDEQAIRDLVSRWHEATGRGDVDAVLGLMADDAVFLTPGHPPLKGRSAFEGGLRRLLQTHRIESSGHVQEVGIGGDLAYCLTDLVVKVVPQDGGPAAERRGSTLSILRRQADGRWLLVRDANLLPPA